jgi:hypothetical protein
VVDQFANRDPFVLKGVMQLIEKFGRALLGWLETGAIAERQIKPSFTVG